MNSEHSDEHLETLLGDILEVYGYDFTGYSRASLKRRIVRLYQLDHFVSFAEFRYKIRTEPGYFKRSEFGLPVAVQAKKLIRLRFS